MIYTSTEFCRVRAYPAERAITVQASRKKAHPREEFVCNEDATSAENKVQRHKLQATRPLHLQSNFFTSLTKSGTVHLAKGC
jgi:hypothetical protein